MSIVLSFIVGIATILTVSGALVLLFHLGKYAAKKLSGNWADWDDKLDIADYMAFPLLGTAIILIFLLIIFVCFVIFLLICAMGQYIISLG
jgi:hypothetical protein